MAGPALDATNVVLLDGIVANAPRSRELPAGDVVLEFDVTTRGDAGTCSVPVVWFDPPRGGELIEVGRAVLVIGFARRRFFRAAGTTQSRTEVVASRVVRRDRPRDARRIRSEVAAVFTRDGSDQRT